MTRHDRPEGRPAGVGTPRQGNPDPRQNGVTGAVVRLGYGPEEAAAELLEKCGPGFAEQVAWCLVDLVAEVPR